MKYLWYLNLKVNFSVAPPPPPTTFPEIYMLPPSLRLWVYIVSPLSFYSPRLLIIIAVPNIPRFRAAHYRKHSLRYFGPPLWNKLLIDWKKAKVHPIYKSDERNIPSNYRPISILPAISKIIERVMHSQLLEYFQAGNLLTESQSGFRPNHSTSTALTSAVNRWLANKDAGKLNGSVFIDLKRAFDTVDHNILLRKLYYCYGVDGNALQLLKSYLTGRTQRCYVNGVLSTEQYVSCGIPQGSILGPLLFIIYINDFPKCLRHTTPGMFADDTYITTADEEISTIECWTSLNSREVKFDVYGKRQTANGKLLPSVFSSLYSRIKIFVFAVNSKRHFSIFVWFIQGYHEKNRKTEVILQSLSLTFTADGKRLIFPLFS